MHRHISIALTASTLALASVALSKPESVLATAYDVLSAPIAGPCTGYCVECLGGQGGHAADVAPPICDDGLCNLDAAIGGGWHISCAGANNCGNHQCDPEFAAAEVERIDSRALHALVIEAVLAEDGNALRRLVVQNPVRLKYAASRQALQVVACDGEVVAHYGVPTQVANELK